MASVVKGRVILMSASTFLWSLVLWAVVFPFIYGQLLSRAFGLTKKIDHWIVFCLHVSAGTIGGIICFFVNLLINHYGFTLLIYSGILFGVEGLIWQLFLRDRKLNGFLVSLICNAVYLTPVFILFAMWSNRFPYR